MRSGKKHSLKAVQLSTTAKLYVNKTAYRREVETSQGQKSPHDPMTAGGRGMGGRGSRGTGGSLGQPPASWAGLHGSDFLLHIFKELQQIRVKKPPVYLRSTVKGLAFTILHVNQRKRKTMMYQYPLLCGLVGQVSSSPTTSSL